MPGIAVNVATIHEGKILLTKREDFEVWCLPSGGVEEGESLAEAAIRETKEETGVDVELTRLVGVYSRLGGMPDVHAILFAGKPVGGEIKTQPGETIEVAYFSLEELPQEIVFGHKQRIADALQGMSGISVRQEIKGPDRKRHTRTELYELRDQSGLSRQQFYLQRIEQAIIKEIVEVGGWNFMNGQTPKWLRWAQEIYSLSQSGLTYSGNEYDIERYKRLQEIIAEIIASQSEISKETVLESFSMQAGYITPKIDVRGAVIRDHKILLIQERADGKWAMPGGWADLGNAPASVAEREVWEESGFHIKAEKVVAVIDANRIEPMEFYHTYKIIFLCRLLDGEPRTNHETLAVDFFDRNHLPPLSTYRTNESMLQEVFAHLENPDRPTAFD